MDCTLFVALSQGMVFLLHKYFCRKIVSRHSDVIKVQVGGGKPDTDVIAKVSVIIVLVACFKSCLSDHFKHLYPRIYNQENMFDI